MLWDATTAPKVHSFWWRVLHDIILVASNLRARRMEIVDVCCVCEEVGESVQHALRGCRLSKAVWTLLAPVTNVVTFNYLMNCSWLEFFYFCKSSNRLDLALYVG